MSIGKVFQKLRMEKGYTLEQISRGIVNYKSLSNFENEKQDIKFSIMVDLLNRLNVTWQEFYYLYTDEMQVEQGKIYGKIQEILFSKNIYEINSLLKLEKDYQSIDLNVRHEHNIIILEELLHRILKEESDVANRKMICHYLMSVDYWGFYEVCLLTNCLFFLKLDEIEHLFKMGVKKANRFSFLENQHDLYAVLLMNMVSILIENKEYSLIPRLFREIENRLKDTKLYFDINHLTFLKGIYLIWNNKEEAGQELCEKSIKVSYILNDLLTAKAYEEELRINIKNKK